MSTYKEKNTLDEFVRLNFDCPPTFFIKKLKKLEFTDKQIIDILFEILDTCNSCWDSSTGCKCWNDE